MHFSPGFFVTISVHWIFKGKPQPSSLSVRRTPPEVVAIIRRAEGSVTVEAEAPDDLREWLEGQRRLHARSGLERERAKKLIEAGVLPRPDGGKEGRNSLGNGPDNV